SRSFWRYWVSAIGKFIPKSGAECRIELLDIDHSHLDLLLKGFGGDHTGLVNDPTMEIELSTKKFKVISRCIDPQRENQQPQTA
ncbi:hypothetical protein, partial [Aeromonas hydrophila]